MYTWSPCGWEDCYYWQKKKAWIDAVFFRAFEPYIWNVIFTKSQNTYLMSEDRVFQPPKREMRNIGAATHNYVCCFDFWLALYHSATNIITLIWWKYIFLWRLRKIEERRQDLGFYDGDWNCINFMYAYHHIHEFKKKKTVLEEFHDMDPS